MHESFSYEYISFLQAVVTGAASALFYTFLHSVRGAFPQSRTAKNIADIIFWPVFLAIWFFMTFMFTKGYFRIYEFAGIIIGCMLYKLLLEKAFEYIFNKIIKFFILIFKYLLTPPLFLYKILVRRLK